MENPRIETPAAFRFRVLNAGAAARYHERGYHFPIRVMSTEAALGYRQRLETYESIYGPLIGERRQKPHLLLTWLSDLVRLPSILDAVEDILGPDILVHSASFFTKEAGDASFVSWHQDATYWGLEPAEILTAWVAFTDSTTENGAMRVVPNSHMSQLPHVDTFSPDNLLTRGQEVAASIDERDVVEMPLQAGEMSLHHVRIIHGSEPNKSSDRRIGFAIRYISTRVRQVIGERDSAQLVRGVDRFHHFDDEPPPKADLDPAAVEFHRSVVNRMTQVLMKGTGRPPRA